MGSKKRSQSGDRLDQRGRGVVETKGKLAGGVSLEDFHPTSSHSGRRMVSYGRLGRQMKEEKARGDDKVRDKTGDRGGDKGLDRIVFDRRRPSEDATRSRGEWKNHSNIPERPRSKYPRDNKDFLNFSVDTATSKYQQQQQLQQQLQQQRQQQQQLQLREVSEEEISKILNKNRKPLTFYKAPPVASPGSHSSVPPDFDGKNHHDLSFHVAPRTKIFTVQLSKDQVELPPLRLPSSTTSNNHHNNKIDSSFYTFNTEQDDEAKLIGNNNNNNQSRATKAGQRPSTFKTVLEKSADTSIEKSADSADVFCQLPTMPGSVRRPTSFVTAMDSSDELARHEGGRNRRTSRAHQIFTSLLPHVERDEDEDGDENSASKLKSFEIPV